MTQLGLYREAFAIGAKGIVHILVDTRGQKFIGKQIINVGWEEEEGELMHETEGPRRLANRPQHRLAQVYGVASMKFGRHDHRRLLIQEYVEGPEAADFMHSMHRALREEGMIGHGDEWQPFMLYAWDLLKTVDGLSNSSASYNIVHSDLKPANVRIRMLDGRPVVFDLGGWVPSGESAGMSTPGYAAPETKDLELRTAEDHWLSREVDERSDVFSIGRMLEEMVLNTPAMSLRPGHHSRPRGRLGNDRGKVAAYRDIIALLQEPVKASRPGPLNLLSDVETLRPHSFFQGLDVELASNICRQVIRAYAER